MAPMANEIYENKQRIGIKLSYIFVREFFYFPAKFLTTFSTEKRWLKIVKILAWYIVARWPLNKAISELDMKVGKNVS
jgi:hypothetical protein